ncbi:hypothetical protein HpBT193_11190 [Helicobacter pylori]
MQVSKMIEYNKLHKDYVMACMQQYKNFLVLQMAYKNVSFKCSLSFKLNSIKNHLEI